MKKNIATSTLVLLSIICIWTLMSSSKKETIEEPKIYNKITNPELVKSVEDFVKLTKKHVREEEYKYIIVKYDKKIVNEETISNFKISYLRLFHLYTRIWIDNNKHITLCSPIAGKIILFENGDKNISNYMGVNKYEFLEIFKNTYPKEYAEQVEYYRDIEAGRLATYRSGFGADLDLYVSFDSKGILIKKELRAGHGNNPIDLLKQ